MKERIVISAISIRSGGMLSILSDCLKELSDERYSKYEIYVIVKKPDLVSDINSKVNFITIDGTKSYLRRLFFEFFYFRKLSKQLKPYLWLSLHDVSPIVSAERQAVYCHNATPFYKITWREFWLEPKFGLFNFFYALLYRINIHGNRFIIVQQNWLRNVFHDLFNIPLQKIVVARPEIPHETPVNTGPLTTKRFIYPSLPRVWKNFEIIAQASQELVNRGIKDFQVIFTVSGNECRYAKYLKKNYGHLSNIKFIGTQPRQTLFELYATSDCLIFPSKLESWGLPISEFKNFNKPILLADLAYTHETIGNYEQVSFFDASSSEDLASLMGGIIDGTIQFDGSTLSIPDQPFAENWKALLQLLLN